MTSLFSLNERSESVLDSTSPCAQEVCKTARSDDDRLKFVQECLQEKTSPAAKTPQTILIDRYEQSNSGISEEQWARHDVLLECISSENPNTTPLTSHDWLSYLKARPTPCKDWVLAQSATISQWLQSLERAQTYNKQIGQLNTELYERNQRVEKELYTARQLQQSLLPTFLADNPHQTANSESLSPWQAQESLIAQRSPLSKCHYNSSQLRVTGVYLPCDALGGDIYDVIQFPDGSMDVSVADVSGHGVPASFITAIYKATCYRATHTYQQPGDILQAVNQELCQLIKTGHYVTTVYCKLRPIENTPQVLLHYSGAGHPYPLLFEAETKQIKRLNENGLPLAWLSDGQYATRSLMLNPGDKLLLFTDGVTELKSLLDELYGEARLEALFASLCQKDSSEQPLLDALVNALSEFADGALLPDDMSLLLVEMI